MAKILSFPAVLFALGAQVGLDRAVLTGLQDQAEDLLACPQSHRLEGQSTCSAGQVLQSYSVRLSPSQLHCRSTSPSLWQGEGERS